MRISRYGALSVVEEAHPKDKVQAELQKLDDRLFLEKQITMANEEVWCVVVNVGLDQPPVTLMEWRDESGEPIPYLTDRIVSRVAAMERDGHKLYAKVIQANADKVEIDRKIALYQYEELGRDMGPRIEGKIRPVLPRSQALRMSRDKMRARGRKV